MGSDPTSWDWSSTQEQVCEALDWCLNQRGWLLANCNLPNAPSDRTPIATKVSRESYFGYVFDKISSEIRGSIGYRSSVLEDDDDILQFAERRRTTATLFADTGHRMLDTSLRPSD
jgi:hypothetical protein